MTEVAMLNDSPDECTSGALALLPSSETPDVFEEMETNATSLQALPSTSGMIRLTFISLFKIISSLTPLHERSRPFVLHHFIIVVAIIIE